MASSEFKADIAARFRLFVDLLISRGVASSNSDVAKFMDQPPQAVSKMLAEERIITLEQVAILSKNTGLNSNWLLKGEGNVFLEDDDWDSLDIVEKISRYTREGKIPTYVAEQVMAEIAKLKEADSKKLEEINRLNGKIIELMELIKKF
jgi:plasmid maintenance system antidote protein VapI